MINGLTDPINPKGSEHTVEKIKIMGVGGLEPPRPKSGQQILSLVRLPIPPHSLVIARTLAIQSKLIIVHNHSSVNQCP